ncbi:glutamyl-tRNA reductase [Streptomyces roseifaciens]|uniref:glutamyl-tRNA reductase n=1 Tax=Streptomyces roseifaciens TaxID=1488406 RepID=UPI001FE08C15|nr:glutamyl-tRNA reductase [Streptomyces roseifaciens]
MERQTVEQHTVERHTPDDSRLMAVGISHATAPLDLLERLYETRRPLEDLSADMAATEGLGASLVLSTCNRMEVYLEAAPGTDPAPAVSRLIAGHTGVDADEIAPYAYVRAADDALRHLFQVAAGLDSVVLGEDQILGQVKEALDRSQRTGTASKTLNQAVQAALRAGKRARNETGLNEAGRSLATAGLAFFERLVGSLDGRTALVIGAGSFGGVVLAALRRSGLRTVHMANRTPDKAQRLAETAGGTGYPLEDIPRLLEEVDVVVSCTASTTPLVTRRHVADAMARRAGRELYLLDLSLPRNIESEAASVEGTVLVDLQRIAAEGGDDELSVASVEGAHRIVDTEVADFKAARRAARATPILAALRTSAAEATATELDRLSRRLDAMDSAARQEVAHSVRRIVDKMLHQPTVRARRLAGAPDGDVYVDALRELFAPDHAPGHAAPTAAPLTAANAQEVMA